jgi:hypothetical protein
MNTYEFFVSHFGRHLVDCKDLTPAAASWKALSSNHQLQKGVASRLSSGWAIVRPGRTSIQLKLAAAGLHFDERTRFEAFASEFETWDGKEPRLFLTFDKAPVPISNLFLSVDRRLVRICSPKGVESFDVNEEPTTESGLTQKVIWKRR